MTHEITKRFLEARSKAKLDPESNAQLRRELHEDLSACRALLEKGWCQGAMARKPVSSGSDQLVDCSPHVVNACQFCLVGGLARVVKGARNIQAYNLLLKVINTRMPPRSYPWNAFEFNDSHEKDEVIAFLDDVIEEVAA